MSRRSKRIHRKTLVRLSSLIIILCFFLNLNPGFLLHSAFALEKKPQKHKSKRPSAKRVTSLPPPVVVEEESFLELVKEYIGTPYRFGGASEKGMDCSGFVRHIYSKTSSLELPHSSSKQYSLPIMKKVPKDDLKMGDLIFFSRKGKRINHVGIYLDDGNFIHAARRSGVTVSSLDDEYWKVRMVSAKRPAGLWKYEGADQARGSSRVKTALNDLPGVSNGADRDGRGFFSLSEGLRPSSWWENSSVSRLAEGPTHTFGFQVSRSFGDASWSIGLLQESHFRYTSETRDDFLTPRPEQSFSERRYTLGRNLQGVKMASAIQPFDWLQITPSFSYVGYETDVERSPSWGPGLGLAVRIKPLPARWSFSADVQYWDESDALGSAFESTDSWKNRNVSLMLGYDLTNDLRLSIVGQHGVGSLFSVKESPSEDRQKHNGVFLGLDWAF
ncbi:MAG: C40 family peptidase [Syntrophales bacterium]|nr:C40 family peptidase [Syntrophales bacterium]